YHSATSSCTSAYYDPEAENWVSSIKAAWTSLLADAEESNHGARHGAPDEQQVSLDVHSHDPQAELRETARAHVPRHPLPLDDARGVRPRRDRPGLAVTRVAVRLGAPAEVMAMHHALK